MEIEFIEYCDKFIFLNNEVSIVYQNGSYSPNQGDPKTETTLLEIKLLNKDCFEEGIFFCEKTILYFEFDWVKKYESEQDRFNERSEREWLGLEIKEDDEGEEEDDYFNETERKVENAFGYYSIPTKEQLERNKKKPLTDEETEDEMIYEYNRKLHGIEDIPADEDDYYRYNIPPSEQNPFLGNEKLERNFLDKTNNDDLLKFSHFKVHLDYALSNINLELKQTILDGKSLKEIGDTQKFIKKILYDYEPLFKKSFEIKEKEKLDKENLIKKLLNEFGLD
jgi:hypothetical protein